MSRLEEQYLRAAAINRLERVDEALAEDPDMTLAQYRARLAAELEQPAPQPN